MAPNLINLAKKRKSVLFYLTHDLDMNGGATVLFTNAPNEDLQGFVHVVAYCFSSRADPTNDEGFKDLVLDEAIEADTGETLVEGHARLLTNDLLLI